MTDLTIAHTAEDGTTLDGDPRPHQVVLKDAGWRFGRDGWRVPHSRDRVLTPHAVYAEPAEAFAVDVRRAASPWVREHVLAHLSDEYVARHIVAGGKAEGGVHALQVVKSRAQIAAEIVAFAGPAPRWYAYVDHYDWICLSQLYGTLVDRPAHWPWGSINLATLADLAFIDPEKDMPDEVELTAHPLALTVGHDLWPGPPLPAGAHHALAGAIWDRVLWDRIQRRAGDEPELTALVDA